MLRNWRLLPQSSSRVSPCNRALECSSRAKYRLAESAEGGCKEILRQPILVIAWRSVKAWPCLAAVVSGSLVISATSIIHCESLSMKCGGPWNNFPGNVPLRMASGGEGGGSGGGGDKGDHGRRTPASSGQTRPSFTLVEGESPAHNLECRGWFWGNTLAPNWGLDLIWSCQCLSSEEKGKSKNSYQIN